MKIRHLLIPLIAISLAACDQKKQAQPEPGSGRVALLDLEDAAKRLGLDLKLNEELDTYGILLNNDLIASQKELQAEFDSAKNNLTTDSSDAEKQKVTELANQLNAQLQEKQAQAQVALNVKRNEIINSFREQAKPIALRIAASRGFDVVLLKSDIVVLGHGDGIEITDEVVAELGKAQTEPTSDATPTTETTTPEATPETTPDVAPLETPVIDATPINPAPDAAETPDTSAAADSTDATPAPAEPPVSTSAPN